MTRIILSGIFVGLSVFLPHKGKDIQYIGAAQVQIEDQILDCSACNPLILGEQLDLNQATTEQLQLLPRIGPVTAERIQFYRSQKGAFRSIEELDEVKGIGPKTIQRLRPYLRIQ